MLLQEEPTFKSTKISIYVSNIGAYNSGALTGEWTTLPVDDIKEIFEKDRKKFGNCADYGEEYFITDYEAPFHIGEYENIGELNKLARAFQDDGLDDLSDVYNALENPDDITAAPIEFDDDAIELLTGGDATKAAQMATFGHINWMDDYIRLDGYGNFESMTAWDWCEELNRLGDEIVGQYAYENGIDL